MIIIYEKNVNKLSLAISKENCWQGFSDMAKTNVTEIIHRTADIRGVDTLKKIKYLNVYLNIVYSSFNNMAVYFFI